MLIIFDLDGTLLDSAPDLCATLDQVLVQSGRQALDFETSKAMIGNGIKALVKRGLEADGSTVSPEQLERSIDLYFELYRLNMTNASQLYPGAADLLAQLKQQKHRLALCTNKNIELTQSLLKHYAIDSYFDLVFGGNSVAHAKPHPQMLLECCKQSGISTEQSLMLGDSINDIEAARRANITSVLITHGYRTQSVEALAPDHVIEALHEMTALLDGMQPAPDK